MLADYLKAAIPRPVTLLGQRLHPFSRGHLLLLLRHECAFVQAGKTPGVGDLVLGVYVCCHTWEEAPEALEKLTPAMVVKWGKRLGEFDFDEKARAFLNYIAEGCGKPNVVDEGEGELEGMRTPGAPFLEILGLFLREKLHASRSESFNIPLGEALHDYFAYYELKGKCKIHGPDEAKAENAYVKGRAEILKDMGIEDPGIGGDDGV